MVLRSLKIIRLRLPIPKKQRERFRRTVEREFGGALTVREDGKSIVVQGERLGDYRVKRRLVILAGS